MDRKVKSEGLWGGGGGGGGITDLYWWFPSERSSVSSVFATLRANDARSTMMLAWLMVRGSR